MNNRQFKDWMMFYLKHLKYGKGDLIKLLYEAIQRAERAEDKLKKQE